MPNKYSSAIRTYVARNVGEHVINPTTSLDMANSDWVRQYFALSHDYTNLPLNIQSNVNIHRIGLFCNLADGLVPATPAARLNLRVFFGRLLTGTVMTGTITYVSNDKTITGVLTTWATPGPGQLIVGDIIMVHGFPMRVVTVTSDVSIEVSDYPHGSGTGEAYTHHHALFNSHDIQILETMNLNHMYQVDWFWPQALSGWTFGADVPLFMAAVDTDDDAVPMSWHTDSISTDFDNATAIFDLLMELEFTPRWM